MTNCTGGTTANVGTYAAGIRADFTCTCLRPSHTMHLCRTACPCAGAWLEPKNKKLGTIPTIDADRSLGLLSFHSYVGNSGERQHCSISFFYNVVFLRCNCDNAGILHDDRKYPRIFSPFECLSTIVERRVMDARVGVQCIYALIQWFRNVPISIERSQNTTHDRS